MKKRLLMVSPPGFSPVRAYRGEGAFLHLPKLDPEIEILFPRHDEPWKDLLSCDAVYCFRTFEEKYRRLGELAVDMGKPLWFDLDDDVFDIRRSHPNYAGLTSPEVQNCAKWFLAHSNVVSVSTKELALVVADKMKRIGNYVIPNAIDDYTIPPVEYETRDKVDLHWRGGSSHLEDLFFFHDELEEIIGETDGRLHFHGFDPWFLDIPESRVRRYIMDYRAYMNDLIDSEPWGVVVPLMDVPFNRCKSSIAALEGIWAGAVPVVPEWEEWEYPERFAYNENNLSFSEQALKVMALPPAEHKRLVKVYQDWMRQDRVLSVVNQQRVKILERLVAR